MYLDNGLGEPENFLNFKIEPLFRALCRGFRRSSTNTPPTWRNRSTKSNPESARAAASVDISKAFAAQRSADRMLGAEGGGAAAPTRRRQTASDDTDIQWIFISNVRIGRDKSQTKNLRLFF